MSAVLAESHWSVQKELLSVTFCERLFVVVAVSGLCINLSA